MSQSSNHSNEAAVHSINASNDAIGDTVFSKHWLFKCLKNTLQLINSQSQQSSKCDSDSDSDSDSVSQQTQHNNHCESQSSAIELDSDAEQELCILWDMSVNEEVMLFLHDLKAIDLFEAIILKTNCPRFKEISIGILANLANNHEICVTLANKPGFRHLILASFESSDTPFLIQLYRLISTSLSNSSVQSLWLSSIKSNSSQFFSTIQYTLDNCLNTDLLKALFVLINKILYVDDSVSIEWLQIDNDNQCVKCLLQASHQLIADDIENIEYLDYLWLILHSLSLSSEQFLSTHLNCCQNEMISLFQRYITVSFGDSVDYIISSEHRAGSLSASISLCCQVISSTCQSKLSNNSQLIDCLTNLLGNCEQSAHQMSPISQSFLLARNQLKAILSLFSHLNNEALCQSQTPS